jgi:hypothetical protein
MSVAIGFSKRPELDLRRPRDRATDYLLEGVFTLGPDSLLGEGEWLGSLPQPVSVRVESNLAVVPIGSELLERPSLFWISRIDPGLIFPTPSVSFTVLYAPGRRWEPDACYGLVTLSERDRYGTLHARAVSPSRPP